MRDFRFFLSLPLSPSLSRSVDEGRRWNEGNKIAEEQTKVVERCVIDLKVCGL